MEKPDYKKKQRFEDSVDFTVKAIWHNLIVFVPTNEPGEFCKKLIYIAWLESRLQGEEHPTVKSVESKAKEYFMKFVPQIHQRIITDIKSKEKYVSYKFAGYLECFVQGEDHFHHLEPFAEEIEQSIRKKYQQ